jgi:hypothetical protein
MVCGIGQPPNHLEKSGLWIMNAWRLLGLALILGVVAGASMGLWA